MRDASRSRGVISGMVVRMELIHCFRSVSATLSFTSVVSLGNKALIESSRREPVDSCVNNFFVENTSRLLGDSLTEVTVGLNLRSVTGVPGNSHGLTRNRGLSGHIVG